MLNIEHLRKQAKLYLRWHREHYYPVAARIRAGLPRYSRLTDREILAQTFRLSDAPRISHGGEPVNARARRFSVKGW